jgi:hypothetical protein
VTNLRRQDRVEKNSIGQQRPPRAVQQRRQDGWNEARIDPPETRTEVADDRFGDREETESLVEVDGRGSARKR